MFVPVKHIISRGLPKTGQTTSYITTDDGDTEIGWWKGLTDAQNRTRFVSVTISGGDVVIDRATGLMWSADGNEAGCNNGNTISSLAPLPILADFISLMMSFSSLLPSSVADRPPDAAQGRVSG